VNKSLTKENDLRTKLENDKKSQLRKLEEVKNELEENTRRTLDAEKITKKLTSELSELVEKNIKTDHEIKKKKKKPDPLKSFSTNSTKKQIILGLFLN